MNKELSHKQIISILLPFTILLIAYFWAYGKSSNVIHPGIIKKTPWQSLVLPLSNGDIYEFTETGKLIRTIHASDFGINNFFGDIQFLTKNEFIIYDGFQGTSTQDNIKAYTRSTPDPSFSEQEGLWRCKVKLLFCIPFTHELPTIKQAFHLDHDLENDQIYLTNTSQHMFYRFNLNGEIVDKSSIDSLKFPNQTRVFNNEVWLADTNHKKINYYDVYDGRLDTPKGEFTLTLDSGCQNNAKLSPLSIFRANPGCWPTSLAKVDQDIWVGLKNNGMEEGDIHIYTLDGALKSKLDMSMLPTPYTPDPISFTQLNDSVIFSDLNNLALYRYDLDKKQWSNFSVPNMQATLEASLASKSFYRNIAYLIIGIFVTLIIIGIFIGLRQTKQESLDYQPVSIGDAILPQPDTMPFWFTPSVIAKYSLWLLGSLLVISLTCFYFLQQILEFKSAESELEFYALLVAFISIIAPVLLIVYFAKNKRLGIAGRLLLVSSKGAETAIQPVQDVYQVGNRGLLIEDTLFIFGRAQGSFINKLEFKHYLEPRLAIMKTMSEWEYLKYRLKNINKESKIQILSFVPATLLCFYLAVTGQL